MEEITLEGVQFWMVVAVTLALGIVLGWFVRKLWVFLHPGLADPIDIEKLLTAVFGKAMYSVTFSLKEARDWIKGRKDKLADGNKAVICKINIETLPMFGLELKKINVTLDNVNFLVIAIVSKDDSKDIIDALLVKYKTLNSQLEEALAKGNGTLVIEA